MTCIDLSTGVEGSGCFWCFFKWNLSTNLADEWLENFPPKPMNSKKTDPHRYPFSKKKRDKLGGGFKHVFLTPIGEDSHFDSIFQRGSKPPTSKSHDISLELHLFCLFSSLFIFGGEGGGRDGFLFAMN